MIRLKRVYEPATGDDGARFLVERLWPRGVKKKHLTLHGWLKDVAPSGDLRKWFSHDPKKWRVSAAVLPRAQRSQTVARASTQSGP